MFLIWTGQKLNQFYEVFELGDPAHARCTRLVASALINWACKQGVLTLDSLTENQLRALGVIEVVKKQS